MAAGEQGRAIYSSHVTATHESRAGGRNESLMLQGNSADSMCSNFACVKFTDRRIDLSGSFPITANLRFANANDRRMGRSAPVNELMQRIPVFSACHFSKIAKASSWLILIAAVSIPGSSSPLFRLLRRYSTKMPKTG